MEKKLWCVWLDHFSIIHFEFLNYNQIFNSDLYSQQLQLVHENLRKCLALINKRNIVLLNDNTRLYSARITQKNIESKLVYSTLSTIFTRPCTKWFPSLFSPEYSEWEKFSLDQAKMLVENLLNSKPTEFYLRIIKKSPDE